MSRLSDEKRERLITLMRTFKDGGDQSLIPEIFALMDFDGNGRIEASVYQSFKYRAFGIELSIPRINEKVTNYDGFLDLEEFTNALTRDRD